jgi:hypothetical protein
VTWVMVNLTCFSLETVLELVQDCVRFVPNVPSAHKSFWTCPIVLLGSEAQVKTHFYPFGVLILKQDRCMVCFERTIGSDIVLDAPNGTPR